MTDHPTPTDSATTRLSYISEEEGTPDTWGWYVVDRDGGALSGPFSAKDEAVADLEERHYPTAEPVAATLLILNEVAEFLHNDWTAMGKFQGEGSQGEATKQLLDKVNRAISDCRLASRPAAPGAGIEESATQLVGNLLAVNGETTPYASRQVREWCHQAADRLIGLCLDLAEARRDLRTALDAAGWGVPEGYALVPKEPTKEMIEVGSNAAFNADSHGNHWLTRAAAVYRAMLAAAPQPEEEKRT